MTNTTHLGFLVWAAALVVLGAQRPTSATVPHEHRFDTKYAGDDGQWRTPDAEGKRRLFAADQLGRYPAA